MFDKFLGGLFLSILGSISLIFFKKNLQEW